MPIDGAGIQRKVDRGFAIAARKAGFPGVLYRPSDPLNPLRLLDRVGPIMAVFDARPGLRFNSPPNHGDALRYAIVDGAAVERGDYLIGEAFGTLFVADKPPFYGPTCVSCNATISLRRLSNEVGFGAIEDRTAAPAEEQLLWQNWPGSMLYGGRGGGDPIQTPGDLPNPEYMVMLPVIPDVPMPQPGDVLVDGLERRFSVAWAEQSSLGWRIIARLMTAG